MKHSLLSVIAVCVLAMPFVARAQDQKPPRLTTVTEERYRLQPGDVLEVQYRYSPEFNQTVTVQPDGYISLEIGGDLKVAGLTVDLTRQAILRRASTRLQDPIATVILKEFQRPYFVVAGEVSQPGKIEMRERVTAIQAISIIVKAKGLFMDKIDNVYYIKTATERTAEPTETDNYQFSYARAKDVSPLVASQLASHDPPQIDERTNTI